MYFPVFTLFYLALLFEGSHAGDKLVDSAKARNLACVWVTGGSGESLETVVTLSTSQVSLSALQCGKCLTCATAVRLVTGHWLSIFCLFENHHCVLPMTNAFYSMCCFSLG